MDLFENTSYKLPSDFDNETKQEFKLFLDEVWSNYQDSRIEYYKTGKKSTHQQFLSIENNKIRPEKFVGYIKFNNFDFNLYPKVCQKKSKEEITSLLLFWLKYSNNIVFPASKSSLSSFQCENFFECLIFLFAKYTLEIFSSSIFHNFNRVTKKHDFIKGKVDYLKSFKNFNAQAFKFYCNYSSFEFNNKFNQIVKYVSKMLFKISSNNYIKELLSKIILILDRVDDIVVDYKDCENIQINRFQKDFITILDYCKLFLQNSVTFNQKGTFETFAFLIRTEKLFEDFVINFSKKHIKNVFLTSQHKENLDKEGIFFYKPDLKVGLDEKSFSQVVDIKYKNIEKIKDIKNADIFQLLSYCLKMKCKNAALIFPCEKNSYFKSIKIENIDIYFHFLDCTTDVEKIKSQLEEILLVS